MENIIGLSIAKKPELTPVIIFTGNTKQLCINNPETKPKCFQSSAKTGEFQKNKKKTRNFGDSRIKIT